ncbi:hypothetical protein CDD82_3114 [Ophiocordyceps australis]|uniref:RRM domain-containing protein n=1 Tax=Ophiocordyceps australis TaxID=1399860 RepID=A0A2C5XRH8_9HYPO|nr:hypothetical protein CDD82_3114 [Ophiocordyceps australis]
MYQRAHPQPPPPLTTNSPWPSLGAASRLFARDTNSSAPPPPTAPRDPSPTPPCDPSPTPPRAPSVFSDPSILYQPDAVVFLRLRNLPSSASEENVHLLLAWAQGLTSIRILPDDRGKNSCASALLTFRSRKEACTAKQVLDQYTHSFTAHFLIDILDYAYHAGENMAPSPPVSRQSASHRNLPPLRFPNGALSSADNISPTSTTAAFSHQGRTASYHNIYSPQSPMGTQPPENTRMSGKSLISRDFGDDETTDLIRDPVAYAENGPVSQRRATAPQIPTLRMGSLSLATTSHAPSASSPPCPSSLPQYGFMPSNSAFGVSSGHAAQGLMYGHHFQPRHNNFPPVNPADQNPPCNTLYVGNLPIDTSEEELKAIFSKQRGYKRLCFRTKQNGPMCFVEFEDVAFATRALTEMYGHLLHNSVKGGIRLSFSKNPLGVRSGQPGSHGVTGPMGPMAPHPAAFTTVQGPPPGLAAPPGLGAARSNSFNWGSHLSNGAMSNGAMSNGGMSMSNGGMSNGGSSSRHNNMPILPGSARHPQAMGTPMPMNGPSLQTAYGGCANMPRNMVGR